MALLVYGRLSRLHDQGQDGRHVLPDEAAADVAAEVALHVLAYNLTRVMNILVRQVLVAATRAA